MFDCFLHRKFTFDLYYGIKHIMKEEILDEQLAVKYLAGDEKALEILIGRYLRYVYNFIARFIGERKEAEDLTQEVFLRVWKNIKKFDRKRSFKTWLFSIARNICIDYFRRRKRAVPVDFYDKEGMSLVAGKIDSLPFILTLEKKGLAEELNEVLTKLPEIYRGALSLYYRQQMTLREIAEFLKEPLNTVRSRHRRGLSLLRKLWEESFEG